MVLGEAGPLSLHVPSHVEAVRRHVKENVIVRNRNMEEQIVPEVITRLCRAKRTFVLVGINECYSRFVLHMI